MASEICERTDVSERAIRAIRRRCCREGLERAIYDAPRYGKPPEFTKRHQKQVIALDWTDPPEDRARRTLTFLAEEVAKRGSLKLLSRSEVTLWLTATCRRWRSGSLHRRAADATSRRCASRRDHASRSSREAGLRVSAPRNLLDVHRRDVPGRTSHRASSATSPEGGLRALCMRRAEAASARQEDSLGARQSE